MFLRAVFWGQRELLQTKKKKKKLLLFQSV